MDERILANQQNWDDRVPIHTASKFYDVEGWLERAPGPREKEMQLVGDVTGKSLVQLQCHFGMETLQWARAGAHVTGLDFSTNAIHAARDLALRAGLSESATFVCSNVYDAVAALEHQTFDVVYVSLGSINWLPEIEPWAEVVGMLLKPGGVLYLHDVHPFSMCFDDEGERVIFGYFEDDDNPYFDDDDSTYTDGGTVAHTRTYDWNHAPSEIIAALAKNGLVLTHFDEQDWTVFQQFPWLELHDEKYLIPEGRPRIPLMFTLCARKN
jgi:SAM-dependent methyltransferase